MNKKPISVIDRKVLSFQQAETGGLPSILQWGELDYDLRLNLWDIFYEILENNRVSDHWFSDSFSTSISNVIRQHGKVPIDKAKSIGEMFDSTSKYMKTQLLEQDYATALNLTQEMLRYFDELSSLYENVKSVLDDVRSPYQLIDSPPTIIPKASPEEAEIVAQNLKTIKTSGLEGARTHLISAAEALNAGDNRGAIREAIHAVESASKIVSGKPHATLPDCLKVLEKERDLHSALKKAFDSLYGYTSNEKGIRHALLEGDNEKVGTDEALFMFSACTAFVSYLARKYPEET